ncbi:hypothetical protein [Anaerocellum danielii]|uniref:CTLH domain-containing protein n=1 Tax=Anaerocellum danielii TaxID=1387557 RepID=A0ABZ0U3N9_9FIRM|nr:hypothetical protein [Caldicellulosiruptor danielii]WPX08880.1 hypothetical protein SOJ16_000037 [Caldicellulosiruptor danielii]
MKKRLYAAFAAIVFIFLSFIQIAPAGSFINIENIEYGIDNTFKVNEMTGARITLTNSSLENFKGKLSFERWNIYKDTSGLRSKPEKRKVKAFTVSKEIEIAGTSKKVVLLPVYLGIDNSEQYLKVYASDGKLISSLQIKPKIYYTKDCVGIFSDINRASDLSYVLKSSGKSANVVALSSKNFPKRESLLEMFEFIIIHNYKTSNLTAEQYQALKDYVAKGGNLIITLGENYSKNLSAFTDDFLEGSIGSVKTGEILLSKVNKRDYNQALTFQASQKNVLLEKVRYLEFDLENAELINQKHIQKIRYGKGTVLVTSFDPFDSQFTAEDKKQIFEIIIDNINTSLNNSQGYTVYLPGNRVFYSAANVKWPSNTIILILIAVYIIFVSFGNYFILKKLNKRQMTWHLILVESVIWTALIFGVASLYRQNMLNVNCVNLIVYNSNKKGYIVDSFYQIFAPYDASLKIEGLENQKLEPIILYYDFWSYRNNPTDGFEYTPWNKIDFKDLKGPFIKNIKDQTVYKVDDIPIDVDFNMKDVSKITIEINNRSEYEIKNVFVFLYNAYVYIERLKPHSKVTKVVSDVYNGILEDVVRNTFFNNQKGRIRDYRIIDRETNLFSLIFPKDFSQPFLIGHIENYRENKLKINSKILNVKSEAVVRKDFSRVYTAKDKKIILPGFILPNILKNTFKGVNYMNYISQSISSPYLVSFYGKGYLELEFDLSGYLNKIEKVLMQMPNQYGRYNVDEYIFNVKTQKWDKISFGKPLMLQSGDIEKYIQNYQIKIRIVGKDDKSVTGIPLISAEGGEG